MSNLLVFTVLDCKANYYKQPFTLRSKGEAVRAFMDIANDKNSEIGKHPEDYVLYLIGEFSEEKGEIYPSSPVNIAKAIELVAKENER